MKRKTTPDILFDPVVSESLAETAVRQIEELILSGVLLEGMLLPSERELAEQLEISRPKVREAVKALVEKGLLIVVPNEGIYVDKLSNDVMSPALIDLYTRHPSAIRDNLEYRRAQEGFAARLAAQNATPEDKDALCRIIAAMELDEETHDSALGSELDSDLHLTIAQASHNRTLIHMMTALYNLNRSVVAYNRDELLEINEISQNLLDQHRTIVDAICASRPEKAEEAAKAHIDYITTLVISALEMRERQRVAQKRPRKF